MKFLAIFAVSIFALQCIAEEVEKVDEDSSAVLDNVNLPKEETGPHLSSSEFQKRTINFNPIESLMGYLETFRSSFVDSYADESHLVPLNKDGKGSGGGGGGLLGMIRNLGKGSSKGGSKGSSYGYGQSRGKGKGKGKPKQNYGPPKQAYGPPQQAYGPPQQAYGPPQQAYGPPQQTYGAPHQEYGTPVASYVSPSHESLPPPPIHLQQAHHQAGINTLSGTSHGTGGSYVGFESLGEHELGGTHSHFGGHGGGYSAYRTHEGYSGSPGGLSSPSHGSNSLIFALPAGGSGSQSTYNSFGQGGVSHFGSSGYSSTPSSVSSGSGFSSTPATIVLSTSSHNSPGVSSLGGSGYSTVSSQGHSTPSLHLSQSSPSSISSYSSPAQVVSTTPRPSVVFSTPSHSTISSSQQGSSVSIPSGVYSTQFLDPFKIMSAPNLSSYKNGKISYISSGHRGVSTPASAVYSSPAVASSSTPASASVLSSNHVAKHYSSSNSHATFHRPAASSGATRIPYPASGATGYSHSSGAIHRGNEAHGAVASTGKVSTGAAYSNVGTGGHSASASGTGYREQAHSASYNAQNPVVHSQNIYLPSQGGTYILGGENGYDDNDPIIEIVVQESNVTLPPPPPITIPHSATDNPQEPVQVFFVKYDGAVGGAGHSDSSAGHGAGGVRGYHSNVQSSPKLNLIRGSSVSSTPSTRSFSSITPAYDQGTTGYRTNRSPSPFYTNDLPFNHKLPTQNKVPQENKDYPRSASSRAPDSNSSPSSPHSSIPNILNAVKQQLDSKGGPYTATVQFLDYPLGLSSTPSPLYSSVTPTSTLSLRPKPYRKLLQTTPKSSVSLKVTPDYESSKNATQISEPRNGEDDKVVVITSVVQSESSSSAKVNYSDGPKYIELKRTGQAKSGGRSGSQS